MAKKPQPIENLDEIIDYCIDCYKQGYGKVSTKNMAKEKFGINIKDYQNRILPKIKEYYDNLRMEINDIQYKDEQIDRLLLIYKEALENKNYQASIKALTEINKLLGFDIQKLEVKADVEYKLDL